LYILLHFNFIVYSPSRQNTKDDVLGNKKCVHSMDLNRVVLDSNDLHYMHKTIFQKMFHGRKQVKQHCKDVRCVNDDRSFTFW